MTNNNTYRLGLDLGTNSIGWAMLALNENNEPHKIIDAGVRIFSDGRDPQSKEPLAVARRIARGARRRRDRFLARKEKLMNYLIKIGLMPEDELERKKLELLNPYELRTKALDQALQPYELGRAIFHLNQRRGFKSNRKEIVKEEGIKKSKTIGDQNLLKQRIEEVNSRTLGEFFYKERILKEKTTRAKDGEEGLYPTRDLYEKEFDLIVKSQTKYHPQITAENWQEIRNEVIFHQRPLAPQEKGVCQLINKFQNLPNSWELILENYRNLNSKNKTAKGLPRAYLALPSYQKFRILSEVNNLKVVDPNMVKIDLAPSEKQIIIDILNKQNSSAFSKLRKAIANKENSYDTDDFSFNLESSRRKVLDGDTTSSQLSKPEYFDKEWFNFDLKKQDEIVGFILDANQSEEIVEKATKDWNLDLEKANNLSKVEFKSGVGNLCEEILRELVAKMQQNYCRYDEATQSLLEFSHSGSKTLEEIEKQPIQDQLKYYGEVLQASTASVKVDKNKKDDYLNDEEKFGKIANPTVHIALNQLRKVVNEIIKNYGNPSEISVELARELKLSKDEKEQMKSVQGKNQTENKRISQKLKEDGIADNYDNRLKYKLWEELAKDPNDRKCIYSGIQIPANKIFSNEVEIEHILPFSKTFDDSVKNKTISYRKANQNKGDRSPYDAFGNSPTGYNYEEIKSRANNLPKNKSWRFYPDAMEKFNDESGFIARQLNDTRYLSRLATQYLSNICKANKINVANGQITSLLRHHWGLNSILNKTENQKLRDDHRHHAVDALIVAMTDRSTFKKLSTAKNYYSKITNNNFEYVAGKFKVEKPWESFKQEAEEAIEKIIVSHKLDHGTNGKLHEETYYGIIEPAQSIERNGKVDNGYNFVYRKNLSSLSENEIERIRDEKIYRELSQKLKGVSDKKEIEKILSSYAIKGKNGETKVKKIRLIKKENRFAVINHKQVALQEKRLGGIEEKIHQKGIVGSNHHIAIWKLPQNLKFLSAINLKGKKLEKFKEDLKEDEKAKFEEFVKQDQEILNHKLKQLEIFENRIQELKGWASKDYDYAVICISAFEAINKDNDKKPHPAAKLLAKIHGGDLIKFKNGEDFVIAKITKLNPAGNKIIGVKHRHC